MMTRLFWLPLALSLVMTASSASAESGEAAPRTIVLTHTPQLGSVVGRRMLGHLVACALEANVVASATYAGETFTFPGAFGLAPRWLERSPSVTEQRWVSACIMAQVNYFGVGIAVSLRAPGLALESLTPSEKDLESFTVPEGGYFGNPFAPAPVAFVCQGERTGDPPGHLGSRKRVCAEPADDPGLAEQGVSRCGFRIVGACDQLSAFEIVGQRYSEVVHVYLRPDRRP